MVKMPCRVQGYVHLHTCRREENKPVAVSIYDTGESKCIQSDMTFWSGVRLSVGLCVLSVSLWQRADSYCVIKLGAYVSIYNLM